MNLIDLNLSLMISRLYNAVLLIVYIYLYKQLIDNLSPTCKRAARIIRFIAIVPFFLTELLCVIAIVLSFIVVIINYL